MVMRDTTISDFVSDLRYEPMKNYTHQFVEIALDRFVGQNAEQENKLLSNLLDQIEELEANTIIITPVTEDGSKTFFPTENMSTATDILNRVTHQLNSRLGIRHIYLRLSGNFDFTKNESVLNDMSRLAWFNGVVFDDVEKERIETIKRIVEYYHPNSSFGFYGEPKKASAFDFVVLPVSTNEPTDEIRDRILKATGVPVKLFVQVSVSDDDDSTLPGVIDMIRNLGIKHYGVAHKNDLYGQVNAFSHANDMAKDTLAVFGG